MTKFHKQFTFATALQEATVAAPQLMAEREWSPESKVALLKEEYKLKLSFGHTCLRDRIASQVDLIID